MALPEGQIIGNYRVLRIVGEGPRGTVYEAEQTGLDRRVALKIFSTDDRRRVERVARATARLKSPRAVELFELRPENDPPFVATAIARGHSLTTLISVRVESARAVRIVMAVLDALEEAHAQGVVHGNLRPTNIFVEGDHAVQLTDLGLDLEEIDQTRTSVLSLEKTAGYRAPEQLRAEAVDARADLFAVGVILFELLEGRRPFQAPKGVDEVAGLLSKEPPRSRSPWANVIARALAKKPGARFATAAAMKKALAPPRRWPLALIPVVLVSIGVGVIIMTRRADPPLATIDAAAPSAEVVVAREPAPSSVAAS